MEVRQVSVFFSVVRDDDVESQEEVKIKKKKLIGYYNGWCLSIKVVLFKFLDINNTHSFIIYLTINSSPPPQTS